MSNIYRDILSIIALVLMGVAWINGFSFMGLVMMLAAGAIVIMLVDNETKPNRR